jgi:hypothetical protein
MKALSGFRRVCLYTDSQSVVLNRLGRDTSFNPGIITLQGGTSNHYGGAQPSLNIVTMDGDSLDIIRQWADDRTLVRATVEGHDMILLWNVPEAIVLTESPASGANDGAVPYLITMTTAGYMPDVVYGSNVLEAYSPFNQSEDTYALTGFTTPSYVRPRLQLALGTGNGTASIAMPMCFPGLPLRLTIGTSSIPDSPIVFTKQIRVVQRNSAGATISTHTQSFTGDSFEEVTLDFTVASTCRSLLIAFDYTYVSGGTFIEVFISTPMLSLQNRTERVVF